MPVIERCQNADRERGRAATLDELNQGMEVEALVSGNLRGQGKPEAAADELIPPPGHKLKVLSRLLQFTAHISFVFSIRRFLPHVVGASWCSYLIRAFRTDALTMQRALRSATW